MTPKTPKDQKIETACQHILEILEKDSKHRHGSRITKRQIAAKVRLHQDTVGRYMRAMWKQGRLLRTKATRGWTYRCLVDGEDIETFRNGNDSFWKAYVEPENTETA